MKKLVTLLCCLALLCCASICRAGEPRDTSLPYWNWDLNWPLVYGGPNATYLQRDSVREEPGHCLSGRICYVPGGRGDTVVADKRYEFQYLQNADGSRLMKAREQGAGGDFEPLRQNSEGSYIDATNTTVLGEAMYYLVYGWKFYGDAELYSPGIYGRMY